MSKDVKKSSRETYVPEDTIMLVPGSRRELVLQDLSEDCGFAAGRVKVLASDTPESSAKVFLGEKFFNLLRPSRSSTNITIDLSPVTLAVLSVF